MTDQRSFSARLLKAVYFPGCDLLESELGAHPSQIWRAMLDGRDILAQGVIRRIGDGTSTSIWTHNWIPRDNFKWPITSLVPNPSRMVADLIDGMTVTWRKDLVHSVFTHFDAAKILKIPLCTRTVTNFWEWHEESRGRFTVRSAYRMIVRTKISRRVGFLKNQIPHMPKTIATSGHRYSTFRCLRSYECLYGGLQGNQFHVGCY